MLCDSILDNHAEVNGYTARLTLIRVTSLLREEGPYEDSTSNRVLRMLKNLCYIQELAYATESQRNLRNILALHNLTFVFYLDYKKVRR